MGKHAVGLGNGNFRNGDYLLLAKQIIAEAQDPDYIHPRDKKLNQLRALMGEKEYQTWYAKNQYTRPLAKWEALIDSTLARYQHVIEQVQQAEERAYYREQAELYALASGR